jgi:hypothetical protein
MPTCNHPWRQFAWFTVPACLSGTKNDNLSSRYWAPITPLNPRLSLLAIRDLHLIRAVGFDANPSHAFLALWQLNHKVITQDCHL